MCSCDDYDPPAFYSEDWLRARKPYRCHGCRIRIEVGARYLRCSGKWDLDVSSFAVCAICDALKAGFNAVAADPGCVPPTSQFRSCLREELRDSGASPREFWSTVHHAALAAMRDTQRQWAEVAGRKRRKVVRAAEVTV